MEETENEAKQSQRVTVTLSKVLAWIDHFFQIAVIMFQF